MDLLSKYANKLPGQGEPGVFDDLIKGVRTTNELSKNHNVEDNVGENAKTLQEQSGNLLGLMTETNRLSYFVKDNKDVNGAVEEGSGIIAEINKILKKIANINCFTKLCLLGKLLKKLSELKETLEEYIGKVKGFVDMAKKSATDWVKEKMKGEALGKVSDVASKYAGGLVDKVKNIW
ncbi:unnamed protein product [Moneuplotes crassus]|uniref:Uncharacterized protein n=1 Tax=Euplotes crassus TaxID=5936 RepID=A0AAD1XX48_EUPCR|nr:unnamed protein product [Moneuplotes crassus]